ncbi:MAG: zinc-ribbon domain-containing protein [Muribaculaceae bacterium]|nr:zinc-ribbon domain-containing protein [Muribaculaceae bacterium]
MSTITCPNCGNQLPEDSAFCNKCGSRIEMKEKNYRRDYENWDDDDREPRYRDNRGKKKNNTTLYVVIAIGVLAFLSILFISKKYFSGNTENREAEMVSIVDNSNSAAADALQRALNDNNYVGDGARIVYAMRISGSEPGKNDKIIGITQLNGSDSFYKLYELIQNGDNWTIDPEHVKMVPTTGRDVSFDQDKLKAGVDVIPQSPEIDGKKYFFYAFLSTPRGETSNRASVVLNLYDVESRNITSVTYEGTFQNVGGEQAIVCSPASGSSETIKWMNEQARNFIRILSLGSGEEKEDNKAEEQQAVQAPVQQAPVAAPEQSAEASQEASQSVSQAGVGEEKDKDTPMFNKDDIVETKQAGNYKVFRLKDGSVVRYDRSTGKNTKIHQGGAEAIGFEDTQKGILNIRKSDGSREQIDLNNGQKTSKPAASQPAAQPAEKKTE